MAPVQTISTFVSTWHPVFRPNESLVPSVIGLAQSMDSVWKVLLASAVTQAQQGAKLADKRTTIVALDILDGFRLTMTISGYVGGEWQIIAQRHQWNIGRLLQDARAKGALQSRLRAQVKSKLDTEKDGADGG